MKYVINYDWLHCNNKELVKELEKQTAQLAELKAELDSYEVFYKANGFWSKDDFLGYVINTMMKPEDKANEIRRLKQQLKEKDEGIEKLKKEIKESNKTIWDENKKAVLCGDCYCTSNFVREKILKIKDLQQLLKEKDAELKTNTKQVCENIRKTLADNEYIYSFINPKNKNKANMDGYFDCLEEIKDALDQIERGIK